MKPYGPMGLGGDGEIWKQPNNDPTHRNYIYLGNVNIGTRRQERVS